MKLLLLAIVSSAVLATPIPDITTTTSNPWIDVRYNDNELLNFVLGLEHFQNSFYSQGLANFTQAEFAKFGFEADFYTNLTIIAAEEQTHVTKLTELITQLEINPVKRCIYNFNVSNPVVFANVATLLESVSVSSYLEILPKLSQEIFRIVTAGVLPVEARHSSFIRAALGREPFPTAYETPLTLDEIYTLVQLFVVSCPAKNLNPLNLINYPTLSSSYSNYGQVGAEVTFVTYGRDINAGGSDSIPLYTAFLTPFGPVFSPTIRIPGLGFNTTVPVAPAGYQPINGLTYVVLSASNTTITRKNILAGPASIEIFHK